MKFILPTIDSQNQNSSENIRRVESKIHQFLKSGYDKLSNLSCGLLALKLNKAITNTIKANPKKAKL